MDLRPERPAREKAERDLHGLAVGPRELQQDAPHLGDERAEAEPGLGMAVGLDLRRDRLVHDREARRLAEQFQHPAVQVLRVRAALRGKVPGAGQVLVAEEERHEVGQVAGALGAAAGDEGRARAGDAFELADQLVDEAAEVGRCAVAEAGHREFAVEDERPVGHHRRDAGERKVHISVPRRSAVEEAEAQLGQVHGRGGAVGMRDAVADLDLAGGVAGAGRLPPRRVDLGGARQAHRQRQKDDALPGRRGDRERLRVGAIIGEGEGRAVRHHAARAPDADLALGEQPLFEFQLAEAPSVVPQPVRGGADEALHPAVLLLEVLGAEEHALRPDDAAGEGHAPPPSERATPPALKAAV